MTRGHGLRAPPRNGWGYLYAPRAGHPATGPISPRVRPYKALRARRTLCPDRTQTPATGGYTAPQGHRGWFRSVLMATREGARSGRRMRPTGVGGVKSRRAFAHRPATTLPRLFARNWNPATPSPRPATLNVRSAAQCPQSEAPAGAFSVWGWFYRGEGGEVPHVRARVHSQAQHG